ncbi:tetratricopeptide repeat protein [Paucidesulfovibrio longus]|uniref:tetratricopeptide repeat protein n=1 Tax=Paucidesulfovibrio longus TaxID=889 RepID=UPI0003B48FCE|nr:tetratricopeptide repeat protein [Paucidesulfovibrio longus]
MQERDERGREVLGVYSHSLKYQYQFGERGSSYRQGTYWFVIRLDEERYSVQPLNGHHLPSGVTKTVTKEEFLQYYTPEMEYFRKHTAPALESLREKLFMGRRFFDMGRLDKAEKLFCSIVLQDETNIDANTGLTEVYANQKRFTDLRTVLDRLFGVDDLFREQQRHKFNEFGILLRKQGLFDDAVRFYRKALEVNPEDDHLHFNLARAYYERGRKDSCLEHLYECLRLNPGLVEAACFLDHIEEEDAKESGS